MAEKKNLRTLLLAAYFGAISERDLTELAKHCRVIAERFFLSHRLRFISSGAKQGLSLQDVVIDCIAEVFLPVLHGGFQPIRNFIQSLASPLDEIADEDLNRAFRAFVVTVADRAANDMYAEWDPVGTKISRNIREALSRKSAPFRSVVDFRGRLLALRDVDPQDELPPYPVDKLEVAFRANVGRRQTIPAMLAVLAKVLCAQDEYRKSMPLADAVQIIKRSFVPAAEPEEELGAIQMAGLDDERLNQLRWTAIAKIREKIIETYAPKKRLTLEEATILAETSERIIASWFEAGATPDSYQEVFLNIHPVSTEEYRRRWKARVEYLAKTAKQLMVRAIENDVFRHGT